MKTYSKFFLILTTLSLLLVLGVLVVSADPGLKIDVCHLAATGDYIKINISENAFPAHVDHGDSSPGEPVPGMGGYIFGDDCQPYTVYSFKLTGSIFEDSFADGKKDVDDPGMSGWTITLRGDGPDGGVIDLTETTDDSGNWEWLSPEYIFMRGDILETVFLEICEVMQDGWTQSYPVDNNCSTLDFTPIAGSVGDFGPYDFGNWSTASTSGMKFEDLYADGIEDIDDPSQPDWTIFVDYDDDDELDEGEPFASTIANGTFTINGVNPGVWKVKEVVQTGWTCSYPDALIDDGIQCWHKETFKSSQTLSGNNFGSWQPVRVTACKQSDADGDVTTTEDQVPLEGWQILRTEEGKVPDTQSTGTEGCYTWDNLTPGISYGVQEEDRAGWDALGEMEWVFEKAKSGESYNHTFYNQENIPVIVLPGVMGSKLYNMTSSLLCPFTVEVWTGHFLWGGLVLENDGITSNCDIHPDLTQDEFGVRDTYIDIVTALQNSGYEVRYFPYDWRLSLEYNAVQLDNQLSAWGYDKVYLIGHSMGGLLARTYVENSVYAAKVEKVITIGAPYLGAPTLAPKMRAGIVPIPGCEDFGICISTLTVFNLIRNSPGIMQLLPSRAYFDRGNPYGLDYYYSYYELFQGQIKLTSLDSTHNFFKTNYGTWGAQNSALLDKAVEYHNTYDDFSDINVEYHVIAVGNFLTPLTYYETCLPVIGCIFEVVKYKYGDDTVPLNSATNLGITNDNVQITKLFGATNRHQDLTKDPLVLNKIKEILGSTQTVSIQGLSVFEDTPAPPYIKLFVLGSTEVSISDGTHYIGLDQNGMTHNDILGATYQAFGYQTEVVLPSDRAYTVTFKQTGDIPLQVKVSELTAPSYEGVFTASYQVMFDDVPLSTNGVATMTLDLAAGLDSLTLSLINVGQPMEIVRPSSVLDLK